jgi:hypothetical protein
MIVLALALSAGPATALAQSPEPPRLTVGGGAGIAFPLHGDFDFNPAAWNASVRARVTSRAWIEGAYEEWRHSEARTLTNQPIQGPTGHLGRIDRIDIETRHTVRTVGVRGLFGGTSGRISLWGGGGPAFLQYERRFQQAETGCSGTIACGGFDRTHSSSSFAVQGLAGLDVAVTRWLAVYGQYAAIFPVDDPGFGHQSVMGGVRLGLVK